MPLTAKQRVDFDATIRALRETEIGKEATMYTVLRDLFVDLLQYPRTSVVVDTAGRRGRPDLTVYAPGGATGGRVAWIVLEAKDERDAVSDPAKRLKLYAEKAKYITSDTAYIVMVDPVILVGPWRRHRQTGGRRHRGVLERPDAGAVPRAAGTLAFLGGWRSRRAGALP